jgi:hypothetical protein
LSNEIRVAFNDGYTIYVIIRDTTGQIWDVGDGAFEAVGTWNDARVGECDIALTAKDGELYHYIGAEEFSWTGSSKILIAMHHYMAL